MNRSSTWDEWSNWLVVQIEHHEYKYCKWNSFGMSTSLSMGTSTSMDTRMDTNMGTSLDTSMDTSMGTSMDISMDKTSAPSPNYCI